MIPKEELAPACPPVEGFADNRSDSATKLSRSPPRKRTTERGHPSTRDRASSCALRSPESPGSTAVLHSGRRFTEVDALGDRLSELVLTEIKRDPKNDQEDTATKRAKRSLSLQGTSSPQNDPTRSRIKKTSSLPTHSEQSEQKKISKRPRSSRDKNLLEFIEAGKYWEELQLTNETVVDTKRLFSVIRSRLIEVGSSKEKTLVLLKFCEGWLDANKNTTLIEKAAGKFRKIIGLKSELLDIDIQWAYESLIKKTEATLPLASNAELSRIITHEGAEDFLELKGDRKKIAKKIAHDLLVQQIELFGNLSPHHLIEKKWGKSGGPLATYVHHVDKVCHYVMDVILCAPTVDGKTYALKLFLQVISHCLKNDNYASAFSIWCAINHSNITRIHEIFKKCEKGSSWEVRQRCLSLFALDRKSPNLRSQLDMCQKQGVPYISCLWLYTQDIVNISEGMTSLKDEKKKYNVEKLEKIKELVDKALMAQKSLPKYNKQFSYKTNFVSKYLTEHKPLDDESRDALSRKAKEAI